LGSVEYVLHGLPGLGGVAGNVDQAQRALHLRDLIAVITRTTRGRRRRRRIIVRQKKLIIIRII
jgi:hypothetical protein